MKESLVKWKQLPKEDATWENSQFLKDKFLNLEDKVCLGELGNDEPLPRRSLMSKIFLYLFSLKLFLLGYYMSLI